MALQSLGKQSVLFFLNNLGTSCPQCLFPKDWAPRYMPRNEALNMEYITVLMDAVCAWIGRGGNTSSCSPLSEDMKPPQKVHEAFLHWLVKLARHIKGTCCLGYECHMQGLHSVLGQWFVLAEPVCAGWTGAGLPRGKQGVLGSHGLFASWHCHGPSPRERDLHIQDKWFL